MPATGGVWASLECAVTDRAGWRVRAALKIPICSKCANGRDNSICVTTKWGSDSRRGREEQRRGENRRRRKMSANENDER